MDRRRFLGGLAATGLAVGLASDSRAAKIDGPAGATFDASDSGAKGDGRADDSAAIQKAVDAAAKGGGLVWLGRGAYRLRSPIVLRPGVTLRGTFGSVPAHNGFRDAGLPKPGETGTVLLADCGAGREDGPPLITVETNATLAGVCVHHVAIRTDEEPTPHPYALALRGKNPVVVDVELLNPYQGIDATQNERHLIRNVHGQPIRRGVFVDAIYDIGRIENVHFNPWFSMHEKLFQWQMQHGEAFVFGRTDWQYVLNTFCFGYSVGYRFVETKNGVCNGNFLGIGADDCWTAMVVDQCAPMGLLVTNGEFVSFHGPDPTMIEVRATNTGTVRFLNCSFWGPCRQVAKIDGKGVVGFSDCTFVHWDFPRRGTPAIQADGEGMLFVRGCAFQQPGVGLRLGRRLAGVSIEGNLGPSGFVVSRDAPPGPEKVNR
ncbi:MAG: glycosyl hydrolase family 28-related protein [Fimbriimonadales bacterium]